MSLAIVHLNAEIEKHRDRADRAEARITDAPHGEDCDSFYSGIVDDPEDGKCNCWKAKS